MKEKKTIADKIIDFLEEESSSKSVFHEPCEYGIDKYVFDKKIKEIIEKTLFCKIYFE